MSTIAQETVKTDGLRQAKSSHPFLIFAGLFLLSLLVQLLATRRTTGPYDEFLSLYGADTVLHGGIPYRDFWTMYGPAQFYVIAALFKLFGVNVIVGRLYDALIRAGLACVSYALVAKLASARWAVASFIVVLSWLACIHYPAYNFPAYAALLGSLLSCLLYARFLRDEADIRALFWSGVLVSVTTTVRHDSGFYLCAAQLVMLAWINFTNRPATESRSIAFATFRRLALIYLAGVLLIALPVFLTLLIKAGFHNLFYDLIYVPGVVYPKVRNLPFIDPEALHELRHIFGWEGRLALESFIVFLPIFAIFSSLLCLLSTRGSRTRIFDTVWQRRTFALLFVLDSLFFLKGLIRVMPIQMMQSIIIAIILLAVLLAHLSLFDGLSRVALYVSAFYLVLCSYPLSLHLVPYTRSNLVDLLHPQAPNSLYRTCHPPPNLSRARCLILEPDEIAAIEDIQRRTSSDDRIYVGDGRHDRLFWNDVRLYFLSGRSSITPWYDLHPGVQTTLDIQNQIIDAMRRTPPRVIVLNSTWDDTLEPNQSRFSSGVTALDDYIRSRYTPQASYGAITVLTPNSGPGSTQSLNQTQARPAPVAQP
jgi:hypothetical protein